MARSCQRPAWPYTGLAECWHQLDKSHRQGPPTEEVKGVCDVEGEAVE